MGSKKTAWVLSLAAALAVGVVAMAQAPTSTADVKRLSGAEAKAAVEKGTAILVDVRAKAQFDAEHAKGALTIPLAELGNRLAELPKDKLIIAYCT